MKSLLFGMLLLLSANVWALPGENVICEDWRNMIATETANVKARCAPYAEISTSGMRERVSPSPKKNFSLESTTLKPLPSMNFLLSGPDSIRNLITDKSFNPFEEIGRLQKMSTLIFCDEKNGGCDSSTSPEHYCNKCLDPEPSCKNFDKKTNRCLSPEKLKRELISPNEEKKMKEEMLSQFRISQAYQIQRMLKIISSVETDLTNLLWRANNSEYSTVLRNEIGLECEYHKVTEAVSNELQGEVRGSSCEAYLNKDLADTKGNLKKSSDILPNNGSPIIFRYEDFIESTPTSPVEKSLKEKNLFSESLEPKRATMVESFDHIFPKINISLSNYIKSSKQPLLVDNQQSIYYSKYYVDLLQYLKKITKEGKPTSFNFPKEFQALLKQNPNDDDSINFLKNFKLELAKQQNYKTTQSEDELLIKSFLSTVAPEMKKVCNTVKIAAKNICHSLKNPDEMFVIGKDKDILPPFFYHNALKNSPNIDIKKKKELLYCLQLDREKKNPSQYTKENWLTGQMVQRRYELKETPDELPPDQRRALAGLLGLGTIDSNFDSLVKKGGAQLERLIKSAGEIASEKNSAPTFKEPLIDGKVAAQYSERSQTESKGSTFTDSFNNNFGQGYSPSSPISAESDSQSSNLNEEGRDKSNRESASNDQKRDSSSELTAIMAKLDAMERDKLLREKEIEELKKKGINSDSELVKRLSNQVGELTREIKNLKQERDNKYSPQEIASAKRQEEEEQKRAIANPPTASSARTEASKEQQSGVKSEVRTTASLPATTSSGRALVDPNEGFKKAPPAPVSFQLVKTNSGEEIPVFRGDKFDPSKDYGVAMIYVPDPKVKGRYQVYQKIDGAEGYILMGDKLIDLNSKEATSKDTEAKPAASYKDIKEILRDSEP